MKRVVLAGLCAAVVAIAGSAFAQGSDIDLAILEPRIDALKAARIGKGVAPMADVVDSVIDEPAPFVVAATADPETLRFIIEANRIDKQVGAPAGAKGSTSLVSSGSVPRLLGLALESGAVTGETSGTSLTFQTNPVGILSALRRYVPDRSDQATQNTLAVLRRISLSATFDTSREQDGRFTGSFRQLSSASAVLSLINHRDPTDGRWDAVWASFAERIGKGLPNAVRDVQVGLEAKDEYTSLRAEIKTRLLAARSDAEIDAAVADYVARLRPLLPLEPAARVGAEWMRYLREQDAEYKKVARSQILTFELQVARPPVEDASPEAAAQAPAGADSDLWTARLIWVRPFLGGSDMSVNASASAFQRLPQGLERGLRDWQIGAKLDVPLAGVAGIAKSQFTLAAMYIYMRQPPLGFPVEVNGIALNETGPLRFLQARLRLPMGDGGVSIPLSVTYANRPEFVQGENEIRGNIGLTFDFDKLRGAQ